MRADRGRRLAALAALAGMVVASACSARGVNGEATDDRAARELRAEAAATLTGAFHFAATESKGGADLPAVQGTFSPPDRITLATPAPGAIPAVANPALLLSDLAGTKYVTRAAGSLRFNLVATDLDALVGGTAADDDDFTGEAFVTAGKVSRIRFQATRNGVHYLGDLTLSPG